MDEIILIGGGGHCHSVIDVIEQENRFQIAGIVDKKELLGTKVLNYAVIGSDDDLHVLAENYKYALITVGQIKSPNVRISLFELAKRVGLILPTIVSPRAYISKYATIDEGTIIMHDALVNANVTIGRNSIINTKALIEHDSVVNDHCHISTGAIINGGVTVGEKCFVGSRAVTNHCITIPTDSFIKAGSLVK